MRKRKHQKSYLVREGMVFQRQYYGNSIRMIVVKRGDELQFMIGNKIFPSLTAAAKYVIGDETRSISGPAFWGAAEKISPR